MKERNIAELRSRARRHLPRSLFEFLDRGSEDEIAIAANLAALKSMKLVPRNLMDVSSRNLDCTVFGRSQSMPIIIAPTGVADLVWFRGELCLAKAARRAGIPFTLAASSTTPLEEVQEALAGAMWIQMYLWDRRDLSMEVLERARMAGVGTLLLTVDTPVMPNREFNARNGFTNPFRITPRIMTDVLLHPRWLAGVMGRYMLRGGLPSYANYPAEMSGKITKMVARIDNSASVTWRDVAILRAAWPGTFVLKGILAPEDAERAEREGVDGIVVSNHGGRNLDAAISPVAMLGNIRSAVSRRMTVLMDGGIRRGSDVVKALALGADGVLIGKAALYGLGAGGEAGVAHALEILRNEFDRTLALIGARSTEEARQAMIYNRPVPKAAHSDGNQFSGSPLDLT